MLAEKMARRASYSGKSIAVYGTIMYIAVETWMSPRGP